MFGLHWKVQVSHPMYIKLDDSAKICYLVSRAKPRDIRIAALSFLATSAVPLTVEQQEISDDLFQAQMAYKTTVIP